MDETEYYSIDVISQFLSQSIYVQERISREVGLSRHEALNLLLSII